MRPQRALALVCALSLLLVLCVQTTLAQEVTPAAVDPAAAPVVTAEVPAVLPAPEATGEATAPVVPPPLPQSSAFDAADAPTAIIVFDAGTNDLTPDQIEDESASTTLRWVTILNEGESLALERLELNAWVSVLDDGESLDPSGEREIVVTPTLTFAPPTYRLSILGADGSPIAQQIAVIEWEAPEEAPAISTFTVNAASVTASGLQSGEALIEVTWDIDNRPATANPVFEQVLGDAGEVVLVELARPFLWIPGSGSGVVAPVQPPAGNIIQLRLSLVDVADGTVYAQRDVPVTLSVVAPDATAQPTPEPTISSEAEIVSFTVTPESVAIGELIALSWEVNGADGVEIGVRPAGLTDLIIIASDLPTRAGLNIPITADNFANVPNATFVLRAQDADGNYIGIASVQIAVTDDAGAG